MDTNVIAAGVHTQINRYRKRKKILRCAAIGMAAVCLCAFAFLQLTDIFAPALPAVGSGGQQALNNAGGPVGAAISCGGETFTLEGFAQDEYMFYFLLTTPAATETLEDFAFILRPADLAEPPASYLTANCGFAFYQPAAAGQPGRILLSHLKSPVTGGAARLSLWVCARGANAPENARLTFEPGQAAKAVERPVDVAFTAHSGETWRFEALVLTPFCARLTAIGDGLPSQLTESYPCEVITPDGAVKVTAHWFVSEGQAGLLLEWQAALAPAEVTALSLDGLSVTW